jgi:hypothetical protein
VGLGAISNRLEANARRARKWRQKNKAKMREKEARRRVMRAVLYRKGGKYYEARKADPVARAHLARWQRQFRRKRALERKAA